MALHRDILWIGRQWAVTGFGMQAIDQRLGGRFDVAFERLWDDDLLAVLREQQWFNGEDFAKGLAVARARYPRPAGPPAPPPWVERLLRVSGMIVPRKAARLPDTTIAGPPTPAPSFFRMSLIGHPARLLRVWRVGRRGG